ncbi:LacI family DNA-binding transcriptional regulator [Amycolatopsis jiangsuensis]|uniref:DNA-binding LacI/PurR family transcriptional regulator n=1 Tax=Amycolatopsis jiangsuensis TaxID=1181879 RepID=A0A840IRV9_9PSEU|nr:LacI family DNA-binding transcriptional regulator [Amycolatopsis jiangsuensis]MBB4683898.1 DNA-binding LacI/PurR family transcriptional regulator [Amycolatopsis jiangsuensis]
MARAEDGARPTLEDVAAFAGVSRSTASRALNEDEYVSAASREKVLAAARDLGYSPNQAARSLVTRRTDAIAVVLSEPEARLLDDPYRTAVMRAGYRELADIGRQMVLIFSDTTEDLRRTVRFLEGGHVDGALVFAPHRADPLPKALRLLKIPVVFGGQPAGLKRGAHVVDFDNESGARLAVEHLLAAGRRRIATVSGPQDQNAPIDRLAGWRKTLLDAGLDPAGLAEEGDFTLAGGANAMSALLERAPDVDAVFVASDMMALGALRTLEGAGRRVPEDVALVGFDDNVTLAPAMTPPLTSVHQDPREQVRAMVAILTGLVDGQAPTPQRRILPVSLTVRASST